MSSHATRAPHGHAPWWKPRPTLGCALLGMVALTAFYALVFSV